MSRDECEHGNLRRQCEMCDLIAECDVLRDAGEMAVIGRELHFQDGRKVCLYDLGESFGMHFTQRDGVETKIGVSHEAMMALVRLYIEAHDADTAFVIDGIVQFGRQHA